MSAHFSFKLMRHSVDHSVGSISQYFAILTPTHTHKIYSFFPATIFRQIPCAYSLTVYICRCFGFEIFRWIRWIGWRRYIRTGTSLSRTTYCISITKERHRYVNWFFPKEKGLYRIFALYMSRIEHNPTTSTMSSFMASRPLCCETLVYTLHKDTLQNNQDDKEMKHKPSTSIRYDFNLVSMCRMRCANASQCQCSRVQIFRWVSIESISYRKSIRERSVNALMLGIHTHRAHFRIRVYQKHGKIFRRVTANESDPFVMPEKGCHTAKKKRKNRFRLIYYSHERNVSFWRRVSTSKRPFEHMHAFTRLQHRTIFIVCGKKKFITEYRRCHDDNSAHWTKFKN